MTKAEFVANVAEKTGLTQVQAKEAVDAFLESVTDSLKVGEDVAFAGFGKFSVSDIGAADRPNPRDPQGPKIHVPAHKRPRFSPGASLKQAVNADAPKKKPAAKKK
jgi:DNA-binding protein HU-beta